MGGWDGGEERGDDQGKIFLKARVLSEEADIRCDGRGWAGTSFRARLCGKTDKGKPLWGASRKFTVSGGKTGEGALSIHSQNRNGPPVFQRLKDGGGIGGEQGHGGSQRLRKDLFSIKGIERLAVDKRAWGGNAEPDRKKDSPL